MAYPPNQPGFAPLYPDLNDLHNNNRGGEPRPGYPPSAPYGAPTAPPYPGASQPPYPNANPPYPTSGPGYMPQAPPPSYAPRPGYPDPASNMQPGYVPPPVPAGYPTEPGYVPPPPPAAYPAQPGYPMQPGVPPSGPAPQQKPGGMLGDIGSALTAGGVGAAIGTAASGLFGKKHKKQHGHHSSGPGLGTALGIGAGALAAGALLKHANPFKKVSKMFDYSSSSDSD